MFKKYLKLYWHFFTCTTMANLAYKADFIAWSLVTFGWFVWNMMFYQVLFTQVNQVAGWTKGQMLILQGFYYLTEFFIWGIVYANLSELPTRIANGSLDRDLSKPVNLQFLLSFREFNQNQLNSFFLGLGTIVYGMYLLHIPWTLTHILFASVMFFIACVFLYGGYFASVCIAFWFDRLHNIIYAFPGLRDLSKVPFPAYSGLVKIAFSFVIPVVLVTSIPSQFLFGQPNWYLALWLSLASLIALWLSRLMLKWGLAHYSSASS
jgi:ABC-2 type transport system permease protein